MAQNITLLPKWTPTITSPAAWFGAYNKRITQQTQSTYDARYPGFNESEYRKLERLAADKGVYGWEEKTQLMDQLYQYYAPQVLNIHKLDQRQKDLNQMTYENDGKEPGTTSLKLTGIAQMAKQKYGINAEVDDQQLLNDIVEGTPNWQTLFQSYINKWDPEFLYASWLQERPPKDKLKEDFWWEVGSVMKTMANTPVNSLKKRWQRTISDLWSKIYKRLLKNVVWDEIESKTWVSVDDYVDNFINKANQQSVKNYQEKVNEEQRQMEAENLDPEIQQYYNNKGMTELLKEWDFRGFAYKALWDAAQNREMPLVIAASIWNPAVGFALMGTDTYARENQEAYEQMLENWATYDQAEAGWVAVWLINSAVEVWLEKLIWGAETWAADAIRKTIFKNVRDEATKKWLRKVVGNAWLEQLKASWEEGLEEVVQQVVQNAFVKAVNENQELFEWVGQAFEWGFYNPMNLLVGWGNLTANVDGQSMRETRNQIRDSINAKIGLPSLWIANVGKSVVNGVENLWTKITDWGAKKITNTASAQDKLYKAQEPRMNVLSKKKDLENKRARSDRANELIVENGYVPTNTAERLDAHQKTLNDIWSQVKEQVNAQEGVAVDQSSIIEKLENYINEKKQLNIAWIENDIRALERELENFKRSQENGNTDLPILENKKQVYNDMIDWQWQEASEVYKGWLKLITKEIGNIEDSILSELPGEFSNLKRDVGALLDSYEDVFKADMKNQRKKWAGLTETYSRIEWVWDIVNWLAGIVTWQGNLASVAKGAAKLAVGKSLAKAKDVDFLIKQWFEELAREKGAQNNTVQNETSWNPVVVDEEVVSENLDNWKRATQDEARSLWEDDSSSNNTINKKTEIARDNLLDIDENGNPYYYRWGKKVIVRETRNHWFSWFRFNLKKAYQKFKRQLKDVREWTVGSTELATVPAELTSDGVAKKLIIDTNMYEKNSKRHWVIDTANLLTTANEFEYASKMGDTPNHINLYKEIPWSDEYFLIGADLSRYNGEEFYTITFYEPTKKFSKALKEVVDSGKEVYKRWEDGSVSLMTEAKTNTKNEFQTKQPESKIKEVEDAIVWEYGTTDNMKNTIFIDNTWRWINGKMNERASSRDVDHRDVANFVYYDALNIDTPFNTATDALNWLQAQTGILRVSYNDWTLNIDTVYDLTPEQVEGLTNMDNWEVESFVVDITDSETGRTLDSSTFDNVKDAIRFIRQHFNK